MNGQNNSIFQIGSTRIVEDESTTQLSNEQVKNLLKRSYPEVGHATLRAGPSETTPKTTPPASDSSTTIR